MRLNKFLRRRVRGAAMAEMVLCAPIMILMWAGVEYFRRGYARRLETMAQSHAEAWQKAYSNDGSCFTAGAGPWQGWSDNKPADNPGLDAKLTSSMFMYGDARVTKQMKISSSRFSATVEAKTTVACNEVVPSKNDDQDVITPLKDFILSFIHL
jgi:hypothetical protein